VRRQIALKGPAPSKRYVKQLVSVQKGITKTYYAERVKRLLKKRYARVFVPEPGGWFSARVLEFPGCFAQGKGLEAAYANLERAAESWLLAMLAQGSPIPPPEMTLKKRPRPV
jgi:predicted RNase H-like HicB family nuclease